MQIMVESPTTFMDASRALLRRRRVKLSVAVERMEGILQTARLAKILIELNPRVYGHIENNGLSITSPDVNEAIGTAVLDEAAARFPLADWSYEHLSEGLMVLEIEPEGFPYCWDTWDYAVNDPNEFGDYEELFVFANMLSFGLVGEEWGPVAERFGWPKEPPDLSGEPDTEKFLEMLEKDGLAPFITAFKIGWFSTGNYFFDHNPYDEPGLDLTLENIHKLMEEYKGVPAIREQYNQAMEMVLKEPSIYERLLKIYAECHEKIATPQAATLAELFAPIDTRQPEGFGEDDATEPIIDEFYGPTGQRIQIAFL